MIPAVKPLKVAELEWHHVAIHVARPKFKC